MPGTEWSLSLWPRFARLLCLSFPAGKKHLLMLRLLHPLPYKLLSQSAFISRNYRIQAPSLRPVGGGRSLVRLNLGNLPSAALHMIGVWDAKSVGTNDDLAR